MDLNLNLVKAALLRLLSHYPESSHNGKTINKIAEDYWEDFQYERILTVDQLKPAISLARRRCKFFPKSADIISAYSELKAKGRVHDPRLMIEETSSYHDQTPEEVERNKKFIAICMDVISKKITAEEGEKMQEKLIKERDF